LLQPKLSERGDIEATQCSVS